MEIPPESFNKRGLITSGYHLPYNPKLRDRARELRKHMTRAETKLWNNCLRSLDSNILRQKPIDNYIVDFYCPKLKLVIEIDGGVHNTDDAIEYDRIRTAVLAGYGIKVLRFTNDEVMGDFAQVCSKIEEETTSLPLYQRGTGGFIKYQSLGNDFILLDWLDQPKYEFDHNWAKLVRHLCDRHFGIGADGVLVIQKNHKQQLEMLMFNPDGSNGGKCLNGIRCAAHYLVMQKNYARELEIFMCDTLMACQVTDKVTTNLRKIRYREQHELTVAGQKFVGHIVDVGNPHFVILQQTKLEWLKANGAAIAEHLDFPDRTNVEFVWPEDKHYRVLVYERGCGITLACGTGGAAVMQTLYQLQKVAPNEKVDLKMSGGTLTCYIDNNENVIQSAPAVLVYTGSITWPE